MEIFYILIWVIDSWIHFVKILHLKSMYVNTVKNTICQSQKLGHRCVFFLVPMENAQERGEKVIKMFSL